jgi:hypothetical protein
MGVTVFCDAANTSAAELRDVEIELILGYIEIGY